MLLPRAKSPTSLRCCATTALLARPSTARASFRGHKDYATTCAAFYKLRKRVKRFFPLPPLRTRCVARTSPSDKRSSLACSLTLPLFYGVRAASIDGLRARQTERGTRVPHFRTTPIGRRGRGEDQRGARVFKPK